MFDRSEAHMGHLILDCMKQRPNAICQIDAATGEEETNASVLNRSIRLARCLRRLGLAPGDILALGGKNHIHLHIPYYAAMMNGMPVAGVDPLYKLDEARAFFKITGPKVAFCEPEHYDTYVTAAADLGLATRVVSFGTGPNSMQELMDSGEDTPIEEFEPAVIDQDKVYAWLINTGGTTGVMKVAAIKHNTLKAKITAKVARDFKTSNIDRLSQTNELALYLSPVQWVSGFFHALSRPLLHQTKVQTSAPATVDHVIDIINKYRPVVALFGPALVTGILKSSKPCDFTCFNSIILTGAKVYVDMILDLKKRVGKDTIVMEAYGQTETLGPLFPPNISGPIGSCGRPETGDQVKLVDPETAKEITEPNVTGELWTKCLRFTEYYNNPEETAKAFTADGWFKTGDLLYRDDNDNYYFVERLKMIIDYRIYRIVPLELEEVISAHKGVHEVSVTSIPHEEDLEHVVACVVRRPGATVSAQEIKDLVADNLSEYNQLRGGVVFMDSLPMTTTGKVARAKLRALVQNLHRE